MKRSSSLRIAISGKARSGKDTGARHFKQKYGGKIRHFSDALYEILYATQDKCKLENKKDPKFLQFVGQWARDQNPDVWVNLLINRLDLDNNCFVADVRYPNELEALKKLGFITIRINRDNRDIDRDPTHESETALDNYMDWDIVIANNKSEEYFLSILDNALLTYLKNKQ
jgi:hypothetical protein